MPAAAPRPREQKPVDGVAPPHFESLYLSNQAELDFSTLSKVGDLA